MTFTSVFTPSTSKTTLTSSIGAGFCSNTAYTSISSATTVSAVTASPVPSALVFQPLKVYPSFSGAAGSLLPIASPLTTFTSLFTPSTSKITLTSSIGAGFCSNTAYTSISSVATVSAVTASPVPSALVFQPLKVYPSFSGFTGRLLPIASPFTTFTSLFCPSTSNTTRTSTTGGMSSSKIG